MNDSTPSLVLMSIPEGTILLLTTKSYTQAYSPSIFDMSLSFTDKFT